MPLQPSPGAPASTSHRPYIYAALCALHRALLVAPDGSKVEYMAETFQVLNRAQRSELQNLSRGGVSIPWRGGAGGAGESQGSPEASMRP